MALFGKKPKEEEKTPEQARRDEVADIMERYKDRMDKQQKITSS